MTPCEGPDHTPELNAYCGFSRSFTKHDWCKRHYVGLLGEDGTLETCPCACHRPKTQGVLFGTDPAPQIPQR